VIAPISITLSKLGSAELVSAFAELVRLPVRAVAAHLSDQLEIAVEALEAGSAQRHRDLALQDARGRLGVIMRATLSLGDGQWRFTSLIGEGRQDRAQSTQRHPERKSRQHHTAAGGHQFPLHCRAMCGFRFAGNSNHGTLP